MAVGVVVAILCMSLGQRNVMGGEPPYPDELKYPNIVPPEHQFGSFGTKLGQFTDPMGTAVDAADNVYIADSGNNRVQVVKPDGTPLRAFGKMGTRPGEFVSPVGVALDPGGLVYVTDSGNNRVEAFRRDGAFVRAWGQYGTGDRDLNAPGGLTVDRLRVYIADTGNERVQVFDHFGRHLLTFGGYGTQDGRFNHPLDVAVDERGNIFVADSDNNRIQKFDASGAFLKAWGKWGSHAGLFATPSSMAYHGGKLFVTDLVNHRIQVFDTEGNFLYQWGRHPPKAHEGNGRVHYPTGISVAPSGKFSAVCESFENRCQIFSQSRLVAVQSVNDSAWWDKATRFHYGTKTSIAKGTLAIAEPDTHSVLLFDITTSKPELIARVGGQGTANGEFVRPTGLALDPDQHLLYVSDSGNERVQVFRYKPGPPIGTQRQSELPVFVKSYDVAALAVPTKPVGRVPPAPSPTEPSGLQRDAQGNLFMVDPKNNRVLMFDRDMKLIRAWGSYGTGKGQLRTPLAISLSKDGDKIYVTDAYNFRVQVFDRQGRSLFSWGKPGAEDGQFISIFGITSGIDGYVYVTDAGSHHVQKFDEQGHFIKKWGTWGTDPGQFYKPKGIAQAEDGKLYVVDFGNHRGQIFKPNGTYIDMFGMGTTYTQPSSGGGAR